MDRRHRVPAPRTSVWASAVLLALVLAALPLSRSAHAAQDSAFAPIDPGQLSWQQKPGAQVPLSTPFIDETGKPVTLGDYARHTPIILDLGYFHCPSLCGVVRANLLAALGDSRLVPGRDYTLLAVSIDPAETPKDAASAKQSDHTEAPGLQDADFHYLTGKQQSIDAVESAVGFRARYDPRYREFLHPSGLAFLTEKGRVSGYVLGVGYTAGDIRAAVLRARSGGIARAALPILLLCFHFDSTTGRYTLAIYKVLRLMGVITVILIVGLVAVLGLSKRPKTAG